ncbi:MAG: hypothetical protein U1E45_12320 [Geminicoccaceae bacterium]
MPTLTSVLNYSTSDAPETLTAPRPTMATAATAPWTSGGVASGSEEHAYDAGSSPHP